MWTRQTWWGLVVSMAPIVFAQQDGAASAPPTTDFSGIWKMDPSRSESAHQAVPIGPVTLVIKQTPAEVSIDRRVGNTAPTVNETLHYKLDGSETITADRSGLPIKTKAHWDGTKLVTETVRNVQGSTVTSMYVLSLDSAGNEMTIDKTLTVQHGYQFQGANNTGTGKDVFIKRKEPVKPARRP